jgi:hypothetical protein
MSVFGYSEIRNNDYQCPECGHDVVWSLSSEKAGSKTKTHCVKHPTSSRIEFQIETALTCLWEGWVQRSKAGELEFFLSDGKTPLKK